MKKLIVIAVILLISILALSTSSWSKGTGVLSQSHFGLWKNCVNGSCKNINTVYGNGFPEGMLKLCQVLSIVSVLLIIYSIYAENFKYALITSGSISLLVCLIWIVEFRKITIQGSGSVPSTTINYNLGYSFYLNLIVGLFLVSIGLYLKK